MEKSGIMIGILVLLVIVVLGATIAFNAENGTGNQITKDKAIALAKDKIKHDLNVSSSEINDISANLTTFGGHNVYNVTIEIPGDKINTGNFVASDGAGLSTQYYVDITNGTIYTG